jgi:hypothetical protein
VVRRRVREGRQLAEPSSSMCLKRQNHAGPDEVRASGSRPEQRLCLRKVLNFSERCCTSSAVAAGRSLSFALSSSPAFCSSACFNLSASRLFLSFDCIIAL